MGKMIGFIVIFAVFLVFIGFNLGNSCNISFGFRVFNDVPVFITIFGSFVVGMICAIPFILSFRGRKKSKQGEADDSAPKVKKGFGKKSREQIEELEEIKGEKGPYGIN
jgi:uncharacterized integral membrane protein